MKLADEITAGEGRIVSVILQARADKTPLVIEGGGTRRGLGRPMPAGAAAVSLRVRSGVTLYEPAEMVIGALAGTPLAEIERTLAEKNQILPFEATDFRALYGSSGEPTIGAAAACNLSGPRRIMAGAARDSLIGVRLVNGRGEIVKSGGRVMKNVTGLDLVKLNAGAFGTLGVLTEVIFKVLPKPERTATLVLRGLDDARAVEALSKALGSPFEVSAAAHLPGGAEGPRTLMRLENFDTSVTYRLAALQKLLADFGAADVLDDARSIALWRAIADVSPLASGEAAVWRVSTAPSRAAALVATLKRTLAFEHFFDWGGGLIWIACASAGDAGAGAVRAALGAQGHATLARAPEAVRLSVPGFQPVTPALEALTRGVKASFDPDGILNPGRMYAGI